MISTIETFGHFFLETREDLIRFFLRRLSCPATAADLAVDHVRKERVRAHYASGRNEDADFLELVPGNDPDSEHKAMIWQDQEQVRAQTAGGWYCLKAGLNRYANEDCAEGRRYCAVARQRCVSDR